MDSLHLLSGDAQAFLTEVWATRVHRHRADPEVLAGFLSLSDADHLITATAIRTPALRVVRDGTVLPEGHYTRRGASLAGKPLTGLVDTRAVLRLFAGGATLVLQGLHRYWPPLTRLISELELDLGHPCQANAYLTPPGSQGFATHADSHDVFVFQTHGEKVWQVAGEAIVMEPGSCLYLPTGTPHSAASQAAASLHVTVGINQLTWRGLIERTIDPILAESAAGHLPAGYLDSPEVVSRELAVKLGRLADSLSQVDVGGATEREVLRFLTGRPHRLAGGVRDVLAIPGVDDQTRLARRPGHPCVLLPAGDRLRVLLGDRVLEVPGWLLPTMEWVRASASFRVEELDPLLDAGSRLVLCRRLIAEGLLEVTG